MNPKDVLKNRSDVSTWNAKRKSASLLIPRRTWEQLSKILAHRLVPPANFLDFLLRKYGAAAASGMLPVSAGLRQRYQAGGQDLVRLDFRPGVQDWAALSEISHGTGLSRCLIFVLMLQMYLGTSPSAGVPTLPRRGAYGAFPAMTWISIHILDLTRGRLSKGLRIRERYL